MTGAVTHIDLSSPSGHVSSASPAPSPIVQLKDAPSQLEVWFRSLSTHQAGNALRSEILHALESDTKLHRLLGMTPSTHMGVFGDLTRHIDSSRDNQISFHELRTHLHYTGKAQGV